MIPSRIHQFPSAFRGRSVDLERSHLCRKQKPLYHICIVAHSDGKPDSTPAFVLGHTQIFCRWRLVWARRFTPSPRRGEGGERGLRRFRIAPPEPSHPTFSSRSRSYPTSAMFHGEVGQARLRAGRRSERPCVPKKRPCNRVSKMCACPSAFAEAGFFPENSQE
jgi:hypothetical protein